MNKNPPATVQEAEQQLAQVRRDSIAKRQSRAAPVAQPEPKSRSQLRRVSIQKGEPIPEFDAQPDAEDVWNNIRAVLDTVMFGLNNIDKYCKEPHQILRETKALREIVASLLANLGGT